MKPFVVILGLLCLGLTAQLFIRQYRGQQAEKELLVATSQLQTLSNEVAEARSKLSEESQLASYLQSNLIVRATELVNASNSISSVSSTLSVVQGELATAQSDVQKQSARVSEL